MSGTTNAVASSSRQALDASKSSSTKKHKSSSSSSHPQPSHSHHRSDKDGHKSKHKHKDKHGHKHKHKHLGEDAGAHLSGAHGSAGKVRSHKKREGPFEHRKSKMRISVPPKFGGDYMAGVNEMINGMIMRYVPQMNGVLLAHWDHEILDDTVKLVNECPFGVCDVVFDALVWAPKIGQKLYGSHSLSSPSHLSLLFSKTFNVSIPLNHIPPNEYEFEHTALDPDADEEEGEDDGISDSEDEFAQPQRAVSALVALSGGENDGVHEAGRWKSKATGKLVGEGEKKGIQFTVIGMQVTNQMLSLTGSLLDDPSSAPPPIDPPALLAVGGAAESSPEPEDLHAVDLAANGGMAVDPPSARPANKKAPTRKSRAADAGVIGGAQIPTFQTNATAGPTAGAVPPAATAAAAVVAPQVDKRFLSARELKQQRKEEERAKRDARKARKTDGQIEDAQAAGAEAEVGITDAQIRADVGETAGLAAKAKDMGAGMEGERKRKADAGAADAAGKKKKRTA